MFCTNNNKRTSQNNYHEVEQNVRSNKYGNQQRTNSHVQNMPTPNQLSAPNRHSATESYRYGPANKDFDSNYNGQESVASTICDSSFESNEERSAASTIDFDNTTNPLETLAKICTVLYDNIENKVPRTPAEKYDPKAHYTRVSLSAIAIDYARFNLSNAELNKLNSQRNSIHSEPNSDPRLPKQGTNPKTGNQYQTNP
jgi:hypothetical protein